jgi:hypothetical protein
MVAGGKIMARQILVPLSSSDPVEQFVPYLDEVAQPDMKVVFIVRYPVNGFVEWLADHWIAVDSSVQAVLAAKQLENKYGWERQKRLAEAKLLPVRQALQKRGIETVVEIYGGDLRRIIKGYIDQTGAHLIMRSEDWGNPIKRFLNRTTRRLGIKAARSPAVMVSIPDDLKFSHVR